MIGITDQKQSCNFVYMYNQVQYCTL